MAELAHVSVMIVVEIDWASHGCGLGEMYAACTVHIWMMCAQVETRSELCVT